MATKPFYTISSGVFQEFLTLVGKLVGKLVHSRLVRQIEYLKVENEILRSKLKKRIKVTPSERKRLVRFGLTLNGDIRRLISIVSYSTFIMDNAQLI